MISTKVKLARTVAALEGAAYRRNLLILQLRAEGWSLREIAKVANLTPQGVKLICDALG